jgi:hypothetical protein
MTLFIAFIIYYAVLMRCILLSAVCPALPHSSTLSYKRSDFREERVISHKMCVSIFSTTFVWNISHSKEKWARCDQKRAYIFIGSARYSCQILTKLKFSWWIFEKNSQISNFMKIRPVGAELFHADRWPNTTELIVAFRYRAKQPPETKPS